MDPRGTKHGDVLSSVPKLSEPVLYDWKQSSSWIEPLGWVESDYAADANRFSLSNKQQEFLRTGSGENPYEKNEAALKKRDRLPERLQYLIDDIAVLFERGFLTSENWETGIVDEQHRQEERSDYQTALEDAESLEDLNIETTEPDHYQPQYNSPEDLWSDLMDVIERGDSINNKSRLPTGVDLKDEFQFGLALGNLTRMLHPNESQSDYNKFLWGMAISFAGVDNSTREDELDQLNKSISKMQEYYQIYQEKAKQMREEEEKYAQRQQEKKELIRDGIRDASITPYKRVFREVKYHHPEPKDGDIRAIAKTITQNIIEATPLLEVDSLHTILIEDFRQIQQKGASGVDSADELLRALHEVRINIGEQDAEDSDDDDSDDANYAKITSENISKEAGHEKSSVTQTLNRLSAKEGSECWTNQPLVRETSARGGHRWELTSYGKLLWYCLSEYGADTIEEENSAPKSESLAWMYKYALGPEDISLRERKLVTDALAQVGGIPEIE
jgi:hypothetical protein